MAPKFRFFFGSWLLAADGSLGDPSGRDQLAAGYWLILVEGVSVMPFAKAFGFGSSAQFFFFALAGRALQGARAEFVPSLASLGSTRALRARGGAAPSGLLDCQVEVFSARPRGCAVDPHCGVASWVSPRITRLGM